MPIRAIVSFHLLDFQAISSGRLADPAVKSIALWLDFSGDIVAAFSLGLSSTFPFAR